MSTEVAGGPQPRKEKALTIGAVVKQLEREFPEISISNNLLRNVRDAVWNEADALMSEDVPTIPMYQKPTILAYNTKVHGLIDNPTQSGFAWNAQEWWIEQ